AWVRETGIRLVQVNGQRKYGGPPPGWVGSPPPSGSEVFIGRLPQDVYEHQLIPLFQRVGRLYEFRLMMTFSGLNRGFAYARYSSRRGAQAAIATLHNHQLRPSCQLLVCRSTEKCELTVDGLPPSLNRRTLLLALQPLGPSLQETLLLPSPGSAPSQIALLKFSTHRAAAMAKKALVEGRGGSCGRAAGYLKAYPQILECHHAIVLTATTYLNVSYHFFLPYFCFSETGFLRVALAVLELDQAGIKLTDSPPASASQILGLKVCATTTTCCLSCVSPQCYQEL
ncbi:Dead end protein homolog 1, partial [Lemmus lemmus]